MTTEGVDYSFSRPGGAALAAAGKHFAIRYLWHNTDDSKGINRVEANDLNAHGLAVAYVYEEDGRELLEGAAGGTRVAKAAQAALVANGFDPRMPVYFAADFDATEAQQVPINAALDAAAAVIGRNRTGLYGGYYVVKRAFDAGKIAWGFQTYAWSGGQWDSRAQLQQYDNGQNINGSVDLCRATVAQFGQSPVGGVPVVVKPSAPSAPAAPSAPVGKNMTNRPTADIQKLVGATADGVYGADTTAKVAAWQKAHGLTADGIVGYRTIAKMAPLAVDGKIGPTTTGVEQLALGVACDGVRGPATITAEQRKTGAGADGKDGPDTTTHLQQYLTKLGYGSIVGKVDGVRGPATIKGLQTALNAAKF